MYEFLATLIIKLLGALFKNSKPTMSEGAEPGAAENRLRDQIKKEGWE